MLSTHRSWKTSAALLMLAAPLLAPNVLAQDAPKTEAPTVNAKPKAAPKAKRTTARGTAYLRVLHAISGGPAADVYFGDTKIASGANFKTLSPYAALPSGRRIIKITAAGKTEALLSAPQTLTKDRFYTAFAYGAPHKPLLLVQNESTGKDIEGKARLRVFHLVADAPAVSVTTTSKRAKSGFATAFKALAFGKSAMKTFAPGTLTLQLRGEGDKVLKETSTTLEAGKRQALFIVGKASDLEIISAPSAVKP